MYTLDRCGRELAPFNSVMRVPLLGLEQHGRYRKRKDREKTEATITMNNKMK